MRDKGSPTGLRYRNPGRFASIAMALFACWSMVFADQQPPAGGGARGGGRGNTVRQRKAVLAWADTRNGIAQHESVSHALAVIERLGYESGAYDTYIRTDSSIISKHPTMTDGKPASGGPSLANGDRHFFFWPSGGAAHPPQKGGPAAVSTKERQEVGAP